VGSVLDRRGGREKQRGGRHPDATSSRWRFASTEPAPGVHKPHIPELRIRVSYSLTFYRRRGGDGLGGASMYSLAAAPWSGEAAATPRT
jgi:hypothetical protein